MMKKTIKERIALIAACGMALSSPVIFPVGAAYASAASEAAAATEADGKEASQTTRKASNPLIIDEASLFSAADMASLGEDQAQIHKKGDVSINYKFYTYTYSDGKNAKEHAKQLADEFEYKGGDVPFILVLDTKGGTFHFIEDMRLSPYTPAGYLASLGNQLLSKGMTASHAKEFIVRADSVLTMNVDGDFAYTGQMKGNEAAMKAFVTTKDFDSTQKTKNKASVKENCVQMNCLPSAAENEDSSNTGILAAALALVAAAGTIAAFAIRRKKQDGVWKK